MSWLHKQKRELPQDDDIRVLAITPTGDPALSRIAAREHWQLHFARDCEAGLNELAARQFAVILWDCDLPGMAWRDGLVRLANSAQGASIVLISPANAGGLFEAVVERGGYDVVTRPFQDEPLIRTIRFAWSYWRFGKARA